MSHGRHLHPNSNPTRGVILLICPVSLQPFLATHLSPVPSRPLTLPLVRSSLQDCSVALVKPTSTLPLPPGKDPPLPCSRCNDSAPLSLLSSLGGTHCLLLPLPQAHAHTSICFGEVHPKVLPASKFQTRYCLSTSAWEVGSLGPFYR